MESQDQIAVFLDVENFIGFCDALNLPVDLTDILEKLREEGRIIIRRSFGDLVKSLGAIGQIKQSDSVRRMLRDNLFVHEDIAYQNQFKNSADMRLAVEMLYTSFTIPTITKFAVIAGDSDYVPVFQKLQEQSKTVIGISGSESGTAVIYRRSCDRVYYIVDLAGTATKLDDGLLDTSVSPDITVEEVAPAAPSVEVPIPAPVALPTENTLRDEYATLLVRAVKILEQDGKPSTMQNLLVQMRQLQSDFNYDRAGFDSLLDLAKFAAKQNLVLLEKQGGVMVAALPEASSLPDREISTAQYRGILQERLKCPLPPSHIRQAIAEQTSQTIGFCLDDGGVLMRDLSYDVTDELAAKGLNVAQPEIFKYIYSLFKSRCFFFEDSDTHAYNPLITGLRFQSDQWDDKFVVAQTKQLRSEGLPLYTETLSKLFYESPDKANHIKRLMDLNDIKYIR